MNRKDNGAECGNPTIGTAVEDDAFYAAWMRLACARPTPVPAALPTPHAARRALHVSHSSHTPEERRRLHPSVVSRLRLAQRFSRRELKDVPHA